MDMYVKLRRAAHTLTSITGVIDVIIPYRNHRQQLKVSQKVKLHVKPQTVELRTSQLQVRTYRNILIILKFSPYISHIQPILLQQ